MCNLVGTWMVGTWMVGDINSGDIDGRGVDGGGIDGGESVHGKSLFLPLSFSVSPKLLPKQTKPFLKAMPPLPGCHRPLGGFLWLSEVTTAGSSQQPWAGLCREEQDPGGSVLWPGLASVAWAQSTAIKLPERLPVQQGVPECSAQSQGEPDPGWPPECPRACRSIRVTVTKAEGDLTAPVFSRFCRLGVQDQGDGGDGFSGASLSGLPVAASHSAGLWPFLCGSTPLVSPLTKTQAQSAFPRRYTPGTFRLAGPSCGSHEAERVQRVPGRH